MNVSEFVDADKYPVVSRFMEQHIEMQMADVRVLLRLPSGDFKAGCNFASAAVLLNLLSGFSVCLYATSQAALTSRGDRGRRFKGLVKEYYSWSGETYSPAAGSRWLYEVARNPLAHSLGVQGKATGQREWVSFDKWPLTHQQIAELEKSRSRPDWLALDTLTSWRTTVGDPLVSLFVPTLYWGTWRLLEKLLADPVQMAKAEGLVSSLALLVTPGPGLSQLSLPAAI